MFYHLFSICSVTGVLQGADVNRLTRPCHWAPVARSAKHHAFYFSRGGQIWPLSSDVNPSGWSVLVEAPRLLPNMSPVWTVPAPATFCFTERRARILAKTSSNEAHRSQHGHRTTCFATSIGVRTLLELPQRRPLGDTCTQHLSRESKFVATLLDTCPCRVSNQVKVTKRRTGGRTRLSLWGVGLTKSILGGV